MLVLDQDESALALARQTLQSFGSRVEFVHSNFREVAALAAEHGFIACDGVLADIGISSMMVDDPSRGFSFMREGPLDMRMDRTQSLTAADVVNTYSEKEIADILYTTAKSAVPGRLQGPSFAQDRCSLTTDLVRAIERVCGSPRYGKIHPATRTFQGLRIYINDELKSLESFLDSRWPLFALVDGWW